LINIDKVMGLHRLANPHITISSSAPAGRFSRVWETKQGFDTPAAFMEGVYKDDTGRTNETTIPFLSSHAEKVR